MLSRVRGLFCLLFFLLSLMLFSSVFDSVKSSMNIKSFIANEYLDSDYHCINQKVHILL